MTSRPRIVYLCTGNAARSVMAVVMTRARLGDGVHVRGAGTFSIPDLPMSTRTREALRVRGLADPHHRSRQLSAADTDWAELIVGFEPQHVEYVRRHHPDAADRTATLPRLVTQLPPAEGPLAARLDPLGLAAVGLEPWEEVVDPAGGDQDMFHRCADQIAELLDAFLPLLAVATPT